MGSAPRKSAWARCTDRLRVSGFSCWAAFLTPMALFNFQEARIVESNSLISRRDPAIPLSEARGKAVFDWHRGEDLQTGTTGVKGGPFWHSSFVKAIVYLADTGPDGGTAIIAGSHKIDAPAAELAEMTRSEPALLHQIEAKAGDALLFSEACCHASPELRPESDGFERAFFAVGFAPVWHGYHGSSPPFPLSPSFLARVPKELRVLYEGRFHPGETWLVDENKRFRPGLLVPLAAEVLEWQLGRAGTSGEASSEFVWVPRVRASL